MSNQIVISSGAKVRSLNGVITGTTGVLDALPINAANGIPQLDVNGKILVSQLPNSVMEYKGTWNANTNTPTLTNGGAFNQGDVYLCNVAGTTDFGAGPIAFVVGDQVIYSGSIWQRASGSTGTVTSVAVTETGDALTITGSPITTSGTINIGFAGTSLQYVAGNGALVTFPTLISSIGLSMPSAFSVANSPLTANGTLAVTGAGVASQYIRGDGTLADFPTSGGGGSSVSYYLNGGTSQGVIGGTTYYEMSKTADTGTGVDFPKTGNGLIVSFLTDANDPAQLTIPGGNWNYEIYVSMSANGGTPQLYAELYKYDGTTFTLISTSTNEILYDGTTLNLYTFAMAVPTTTLTVTDRLAVKLYATNSGGKTTTVHTQNGHLCQIITTFSTGITALNGLTAQVQYLATGTSGTDFNISSATATHTFNLPTASAANRGALSSADWTTFNNKQPAIGYTPANDALVVHLAGTETITGGKTFTATTIASKIRVDNTLLAEGTTVAFKQYSSGAIGETGYTSITAQGSNLFYINWGGTKSAILDSVNLSTDRTYTLPNASGTIALTSDLSSYVPYTGATTNVLLGTNILYSGGVQVTNGGIGNITTDGFLTAGKGIFLTDTVSGGQWATGTTNIVARATGLLITHNLGGGVLIFDTATTYNYTFPSASGTLALTSSLSSYLPLAGGTLTGALSGTSAVFTSGTTGPSTGITSIGDITAARTSTTGAIFLGTTGSKYLYYDGTKYILNSSPLEVGGSVTATSATFSDTVAITLTASDSRILGGNATGRLLLANSGTTTYGIFYGASHATYPNAISLVTDNTERLKITNGGNVGIGTSSPGAQLEVMSTTGGTLRLKRDDTSVTTDETLGTLEFYTNDGDGPHVASYVRGLGADLPGQNYGRFGALSFGVSKTANTDAVEAMRIDLSGNVGIGTSSPQYKTQITNTSANNVTDCLALHNGSNAAGTGTGARLLFKLANFESSAETRKYASIEGISTSDYNEDIALVFKTKSNNADPTERMRITSGGAFKATTNGTYLGSSAPYHELRQSVDDTNLAVYTHTAASPYGPEILFTAASPNNTTNYFLQCTDSTNAKLFIYSNGSVYNRTGTYGTISDAKLKENIIDATPKLNDLMKLKVRNFNMIGDEKKQIGFIAQEFEEVFPSMIDENAELGEDKIPTGKYTKSIKTSVLVPMLVKAIQELKAEIDELKNK